MLGDNFFNLTTTKRPPVVKVEEGNNGIRVGFSDSSDELVIVLTPRTLAEVMEKARPLLRDAGENVAALAVALKLQPEDLGLARQKDGTYRVTAETVRIIDGLAKGAE